MFDLKKLLSKNYESNVSDKGTSIGEYLDRKIERDNEKIKESRK